MDGSIRNKDVFSHYQKKGRPEHFHLHRCDEIDRLFSDLNEWNWLQIKKKDLVLLVPVAVVPAVAGAAMAGAAALVAHRPPLVLFVDHRVPLFQNR